jgi:predicted nucleotidyltransferase
LEVSQKLLIFANGNRDNEEMTNKNRYVLNQIKQVAKDTAPEGSLVLLFGSRARGEARKGSDWDILIVLPKSQLQQADYDQVSYPLVELGWTLGEQINPIIYTKQEWEANSITPFYDNVQRDAISLI